MILDTLGWVLVISLLVRMIRNSNNNTSIIQRITKSFRRRVKNKQVENNTIYSILSIKVKRNRKV